MDEKSKGILLRCARIYFHTKNWPKALAEYSNLSNDFPDDPHILEQIGLCQENLGEKLKAKECFEKAAALEEALGNPEKAARLKQKAVETGV